MKAEKDILKGSSKMEATFCEMSFDSAAFGRRVERLGMKKSFAYGLELAALPNDSLDLCRKIESGMDAQEFSSEDFGFLEAVSKYAASNAARLRAVYQGLPWYFFFVKKDGLKAAEAWIELSEDAEDIRDVIVAMDDPSPSIPWEEIKAELGLCHTQ